jgi:hypothetical protein
MKATYLILGLVFFGLASCQSQDKKQLGQNKAKNMPHEESIVHRKYDEKGNLIGFDSTYTSYYSNIAGDTIFLDSTLGDFGDFFNQHFSSMDADFFRDLDTSSISGFFQNDFFEQEFFDQSEQMLKMMQRMDSVKNEFFRNQNLAEEEKQ